jgi:hypothetical protein
MGSVEIEAFLTHLTVDRNVAVSACGRTMVQRLPDSHHLRSPEERKGEVFRDDCIHLNVFSKINEITPNRPSECMNYLSYLLP